MRVLRERLSTRYTTGAKTGFPALQAILKGMMPTTECRGTHCEHEDIATVDTSVMAPCWHISFEDQLTRMTLLRSYLLAK